MVTGTGLMGLDLQLGFLTGRIGEGDRTDREVACLGSRFWDRFWGVLKGSRIRP